VDGNTLNLRSENLKLIRRPHVRAIAQNQDSAKTVVEVSR
jgi:hypothetical protein